MVLKVYKARNKVWWLFLVLPLLTMLLISPLPASMAKPPALGDTPQLAMKCLIGSICGGVIDVLDLNITL